MGMSDTASEMAECISFCLSSVTSSPRRSSLDGSNLGYLSSDRVRATKTSSRVACPQAAWCRPCEILHEW